MDSIALRADDDKKYIQPQKQCADIVARFREVSGRTKLEFVLKTGRGKKLVETLKEVYDKQNDFVNLCRRLAGDEDLVEHRGGNVSYKYNDKFVITASGAKLKEVTVFKNYYVDGCSDTRPSMETGMHKKLGAVVAHTHPYYVNVILCSNEFSPSTQKR